MKPTGPIKLSLRTDYMKERLKKVIYLDIETSLITARVFRTGKQNVNASQLISQGRILTVAYGTMYDLYTKGVKGVTGVSNHHFSTFKQDPLDDTELLKKIWKVLDEADVMVAHNSKFDRDWLMGRFAQMGWKMPRPFSVVCTYQSLYGLRFDSKKLQELSKTLIGTEKISTDFNLWMRCSLGERAAFEEMLTYNIGDIYDTLFKVYMRTCQYYPDACIDLSNPKSPDIQCKVTGEALIEDGLYHKRSIGLNYKKYLNPDYGIHYVDRYNTTSSKSGQGLIKKLGD